MAWFEGTHTQTVTVKAPLERAISFFADPAQIVSRTKNLESSQIEGEVIHFVLKTEDHGFLKFQGRYACRYERQGDTVRWSPVGDGNTRQSGEVSFTAVEGGTALQYRETVGVDLPVPAMMASMLQPTVGPMLSKEIAGFFARMIQDLT